MADPRPRAVADLKIGKIDPSARNGLFVDHIKDLQGGFLERILGWNLVTHVGRKHSDQAVILRLVTVNPFGKRGQEIHRILRNGGWGSSFAVGSIYPVSRPEQSRELLSGESPVRIIRSARPPAKKSLVEREWAVLLKGRERHYLGSAPSGWRDSRVGR
jgi:hypothetical protein